MVIYKCEICFFESKLKSNYHRHLETKKHLNNIQHHNTNDNKEKNMKMTLNDSLVTPVKKKHICKFCERQYSKNSNLHRHMKICSTKKKNTVTFDDYKQLMDTMLEKLLKEKDERLKDYKDLVNIQYNVKDSFNTMNNTKYVLNYYNYSDADSMNNIYHKFQLTKEEFVKAAETIGYHGALMEKADKVIIEPYLKNEGQRPMHTVDCYRKKALYKDNKHTKWTSNPEKTLYDCFDNFHQSAIKQRDQIILENTDYMPNSEEDSLYKQIYFIPTENVIKDNIHKKVKDHIYKETRIKKTEEGQMFDKITEI